MKKLVSIVIVMIVCASFSSVVEADLPSILKVAYDPKLPPLHYESKKGHEGFVIELMEEVSERLDRTVVFLPMSQHKALEKLEIGEIDVVLTASFSEKLSEKMEFTDSVLATSIGLLVRAEEENIEGLSDLTNMVTAIQRDTVEYDFLRNIRRIRYHVTSNQVNALELLINGRAEAFVGNMLTADYVLKQKDVEEQFKVVGTYLLPLDYSMAVQKENYPLLTQLNRSIRLVKSDGTYSELYQKWFDDEDVLTKRLWLALQVIGALLIIAFILSLLAIRWNRQLQAEVAKKTSVLNKLNLTLQDQIEETKNSNVFQKQILNSSPRGIATVNQEGSVTSINTKAIKIIGTTGQVMGESFEKVTLLKQLLTDTFQKVFEEDELFLGKEAIWTRPDGRHYDLRYYVYPLFDFQKKPRGLIATFEDITEERKMRLQIFEQEKSQALSRVVAGIAHEIRNPLTSIKTFAELIPKKFHSERFQKEVSTYVPQEIDRVNQLIESLIDYAKPRNIEKETIDLTALVKESTRLFERTLLNKGFQLEMKIDDHVSIFANSNQLKQILLNLMINSVDALEEQPEREEPGQLTVVLEASETDVHLRIRDNGIGMEEGQLEKALEPFFTTKAKGTGLGLAIVHQYVHENEGEMSIKSVRGIGTTITLLFRRIMQ